MADLYYQRTRPSGTSEVVTFTNDPNKHSYTLGTPGSYVCWGADVETELYNGKFILPQSAKGLFAGFTGSFISGTNTNDGDTSECTDMSYMFYSCGVLKYILHSNGDTSNVTDMSYMFYNTSIGNGDSGNVSITFDTSNVTDMSYMFYGCYDMSKLDMSSGDTSKLENAECMFMGTHLNGTVDLSNWNTPNLKNTKQMFNNTTVNNSISTIILGENGDVSNLVDCSKMFYGQRFLRHILIKENTDGATEAVLCTSSVDMFTDCSGMENYNYETRGDITRANNTKPNWLFETYHPGNKCKVYIRR